MEHHGLIVLRRVLPDATKRRQWVAEACTTYCDNANWCNRQEARAAVWYMADDFGGLESSDQMAIVDFIESI